MDDVIIVDLPRAVETVFWQWQSGPTSNPWAEKDALKWDWQDYSFEDSFIIENAFSFQQEVADLGRYEVDFKQMVQVNKEFRDRLRRVRRQAGSRFMMEIPEPTAVIRDLKTTNQAFGTIQHFVDEIMKRSPEVYGFYQRLTTLKADSQRYEFEDIMHEVVSCIDKGAEIRERVIKKGLNLETRKILDMIKDNSKNLEDFLKAILWTYTMENFVCSWLNEVLRNENWEEIHLLAPYLVCLAATFKRSEYIIPLQEAQGVNQGFMNNLLGMVGKQKKPTLCLFIGAALPKEHFNLYNPDKTKLFSWGGVTSASRYEHIALNFVKSWMTKASYSSEQRIGVVFKIEAILASPQDYEGIIDLLQNSCSKYPDEREVLLAPGTVFKLRKARLMENGIYEVSLKIKKKFEDEKENAALLENLEHENVRINRLPSQRSLAILRLLKGNKAIQSLEIRNSGIDDQIMEEIENVRATTNVRKEDVIFTNNTIVIGNLGPFASYLSAGYGNNILTSNKIRFKEGRFLQDDKVTSLVLSQECLEEFKQKDLLKALSGKIARANKIVGLNLALPKVKGSSNCEWTDFLQCIRGSQGLQSLHLKINKSYFMERKGLEVLCWIIESSKTLNRLDLELSLSDEELDFLKKALDSIVSIKNLSLALRFSDRMSDTGINHLKSSLLSLSSLRDLSLNFAGCRRISDEGVNHLKNGLLTSLQHLSLDFGDCNKISDIGVDHLKNRLLSLTSLKTLSLSFKKCNKITDVGMEHLKRALLPLSSLQILSLNFKKCNKISDAGMEHLKSRLIFFSSLQHLSLNFKRCNKISNEGLNHLKTSLASLKNLQSLSLNFAGCSKISDEALNNLKSGSSLLSFHLNLAGCEKISNPGLFHLGSTILSLKSLEELSLNFQWCSEISDEGLSSIKKGFMPLKSLQELDVNFNGCEKISAQGLENFYNEE